MLIQYNDNILTERNVKIWQKKPKLESRLMNY